MLNRAETMLEQFCKQVRLSPEPRVQARISWLLDHGAHAAKRVSSSLSVSIAAAALLCPRASACLAADPDLLALAGAVLATYRAGGGGGRDRGDGGSGTGRTARRTKVFLPLGEELLRAAGGRARGRLLEAIDSGKKVPRGSPSLLTVGENGGGSSGGAEIDGVGGSGSEQSRSGQVAVVEGQEQQQQRRLSPTVSTPLPAGDEHGRQARRRRGCTVWETPRGMGLTPRTPGAQKQTPYTTGDGGDGTDSATRVGQPPRARGQTVWETPRGVGLTPKIPGAERRVEDDYGPGSASRLFQPPRARGQTVWETPRGVGLTPRTPGAGSRERYFSANGGDKRDATGGGGVEERKGEGRHDPGSAATAHQRPRARGQTLWETPRGVGLTPKTQG
ncbi:unnamed protein product, partial [Hapterophycus canaliculatus]